MKTKVIKRFIRNLLFFIALIVFTSKYLEISNKFSDIYKNYLKIKI